MSAKLKGRSTSKMPSSVAEVDWTEGDARYQQGQAIIRQTEVGREVVAEVFSGTDLALDDRRVSELLAARTLIIEQWNRGQRAFLTIGRTLLRLSRTLSEAEFLRLRRGSEKLFPFGDATASKLRSVAMLVDEGGIEEDRLPGYTIAYEFTTLPPEGLRLARERNLIRPDVRRTEIAAFRRELRSHTVPVGTSLTTPLEVEVGRVSRERLEQRQAELQKERTVLVARLAEVDRALVEIRSQLDLAAGRMVDGEVEEVAS
ncbi:hypothetical protein JMJ56_27910 [Belnapia sp. T18]|uniref:Uncharacterized protein n=1 Tax=Belnapia arida TaxID=2804533 RepID=A0ABS1UAW1_9PROT|nr:hypothetical protein [Belnapia arida]MBL6081814.1 hypothetical protein [Belnapia arida]